LCGRCAIFACHDSVRLCWRVGAESPGIGLSHPAERPRPLVARNEVSRHARDTMKDQAASAAHLIRIPLCGSLHCREAERVCWGSAPVFSNADQCLRQFARDARANRVETLDRSMSRSGEPALFFSFGKGQLRLSGRVFSQRCGVRQAVPGSGFVESAPVRAVTSRGGQGRATALCLQPVTHPVPSPGARPGVGEWWWPRAGEAWIAARGHRPRTCVTRPRSA
jgi:hypothetical protein